MMNFINEHLHQKISSMSKTLLDRNKSIFLDKPVYAKFRERSWKISRINNYGFVELEESKTLISFALLPGTELIKIYQQIKSGEFEIK